MHATPLATRRRLGQRIEQVVGIGVAKVGGGFGLDLGRFGSWANYEVCSSWYALQFLFKGHSHWWPGLGYNDVSKWQCQFINN